MINPLDLHALADEELEPNRAAEVREALRHDAEAASEFNAILNLKDCVREKVRPTADCEEVWRGCVGRLNEIDRSRRVEAFVGRYAWAICGAFFACILVGGLTNHGKPSGGTASADLARMFANLVPTGSPASAQNPHWVDGLLGQARHSIDPSRFSVQNAAEGWVDGRRVVRLGLRDASGDLVLMVITGSVSFDGMEPLASNAQFQAGQMGRANFVTWRRGETSLVLFGVRSPDELAQVAGRISVQ